ncbi:hypothetical protein GCM10023196_050830 [Actinoallomurus vinaceus]|uniref:Uncharacterized protein n=1 Tax=Actinoallomurus vinaceus TaxID=1080074 RepID=A0ABP8UF41_9ACTN
MRVANLAGRAVLLAGGGTIDIEKGIRGRSVTVMGPTGEAT